MIAILDFGVGNVGSIANMLKRAGASVVAATTPVELETATGIVLPGVGAFDAAMEKLSRSGLMPALRQAAVERQVPVLGVCLGMQLLGLRSEEGVLPGLGWIPAESRRFTPDAIGPGLRIPHMGWNTVRVEREHPLFRRLESENRFYFVHSYHMVCSDRADTMGETVYGHPFASAVAHGNICGVQFHPEKSHRFGMALLSNFAEMGCSSC